MLKNKYKMGHIFLAVNIFPDNDAPDVFKNINKFENSKTNCHDRAVHRQNGELADRIPQLFFFEFSKCFMFLNTSIVSFTVIVGILISLSYRYIIWNMCLICFWTNFVCALHFIFSSPAIHFAKLVFCLFTWYEHFCLYLLPHGGGVSPQQESHITAKFEKRG